MSLFTTRTARATSSLARQSFASASTSSSSSSGSSSSSSSAIRHASSFASSSSSSASSLLVPVTSSYSLRISFALPRLPNFFETPSYPSPALALAAEVGSSSSSSLSKQAEEEQEQDGQEETDPLKWDGFLNAVPKKKVSHSRKRMRAANKGLKDRVDFVHCQACGNPKLAHHICASCFGDIARRQKEEIRQRATAAGPM